MPSKKKKYNARFPAGRIKKIMQTDEEVGKVAQAVPVIISRTLELFVESLLKKAMQITNAKNAKTLTTSHMKQCILSESRFDFLKELVANIPDISATDDSADFVVSEPEVNVNTAPQNIIVQPTTSTVSIQNQTRKPAVLENKSNKELNATSTAMDLSLKSYIPGEQIITPNFYKEIPSQLETTVAGPISTSVIQYSPKIAVPKQIKHSVENIISKPNDHPKTSKIPKLSTDTSVAHKKAPPFHIDLSNPVYKIDLSQSSNLTPNVNISSASSHDTPILHFDFSNAAFGKPPPPLIPITHNNPVHSNISNLNTPAVNLTFPNIPSGISENLDEDYDT